MTKKLISIIVALSFVLTLAAGCSTQEEQKTEKTATETLDSVLCKNAWESEIFGINIKISFKSDGTGHIDAAGVSEDFKYTLSNTTVDPIAGDIEISGTGLSEVDGQSLHVDYSGENLTATFQGTEYTFTPAESND